MISDSYRNLGYKVEGLVFFRVRLTELGFAFRV
jgi:hypothetical protein